MGTKLKNFSRSSGAKAAVYALIVIMTVCGIIQILTVAVAQENGDIDLNVLDTRNYEDSSMSYWDADSAYSRIIKSDTVISTSDFYYAIIKDGKIMSNAQNKTIRSKMIFAIDENDNIIRESDMYNYQTIQMAEKLKEYETYSAYIAFTDEYLQARQYEWAEMDKRLRPLMIAAVLQIVIFIFLIVTATLMAGRKRSDDEVHLAGIDKIYSDVMLAAAITIFVGWAAATIALAGGLLNSIQYGDVILLSNLSTLQVLMVLTMLLATTASACLVLAAYLSLCRKIKARNLLKHTFIWTVCYKWLWKIVWCKWIWETAWCKWVWDGAVHTFWGAVKGFFDFFFSIVDGRRFSKYPFLKQMLGRQLGYVTLQGVLLFFMILSIASGNILMLLLMFAVSVALAIFYILSGNRIINDITKICDQISEINDGNLSYLPGIEKNSPLHIHSEKLRNIGDGMQAEVKKAVKSERMKIDLITNVSHDLKTPLTSIISYVDLLAKTEGLPSEARDYVTILAQKSDRLKHIVSDLFDLAKTTSGNVEINMETLDFKKLIEQTLADMEDNINASGRVMRVKLSEGPVLIKGDGKRLYRVLQNVIDNALKYSMENSRVFIELENKRGRACASVKNTAGFEMEFTAEEVTERFNRGDRSRSTEGSGLGLSIAESFTRASGGDFKVLVDGDLFKVMIEFDS